MLPFACLLILEIAGFLQVFSLSANTIAGLLENMQDASLKVQYGGLEEALLALGCLGISWEVPQPKQPHWLRYGIPDGFTK